MKALVFVGVENGLVIEDKPMPKVEEGDVLVKVELCGICTSDIMALRGDATDYSPPVVLGHEIAGTVVESKNRRFQVGQKVSVDPVMSCGFCYFCRCGLEKFCPNIKGIGHNIDGGYAEFVRIPGQLVDSNGVLSVPDEVSYEELVFLEPLACCLGAIHDMRKFETLVILGAGPIGLLFLQLAKRSGSAVIVSEPLKHRREMAEALKADKVIDPSTDSLVDAVMDVTNRVGADAVIVATNDPMVIPELFRMVRRGGEINLFGLFPRHTKVEADVEQLHFSGHKILASWAMTRNDTAKAQREISSRWLTLEPLLTGKFSLERSLEAIDYVANRTGIKAVFAP